MIGVYCDESVSLGDDEMKVLGQGFREIEIQSDGSQYEILHFRLNGKTWKESKSHPVSTSFSVSASRWIKSNGIPGDAEFIGNYEKPM